MSTRKDIPAGDEPEMAVSLDGVDVELTVELGRRKLTLDGSLILGQNSLLELDRGVGEPVDVLINGKLFARGQVVTVNENFGVRLTEIRGEGGVARP